MATLTNLRTRVYSRLGLDSTSSGTDETETTAYLNEAVVDILLQTGVYVTTTTISLSASTADYTLSSAIIRIKEAYLTSGGQNYRIEQISPAELLDRRLGNGSSSSPALFYAIDGGNTLLVYPTPAASGTITIYHVPRPTSMSSGSHDSSNATYGGVPDEFSPAIVAYACWKLGDREDDRTSNNGQTYFAEYQEYWIPKIRKYTNLKGNVRLPPIGLNRGRRKLVAHDPSTDLGY